MRKERKRPAPFSQGRPSWQSKLALFAFGKEIGASGEDGDDATDDCEDAGNDPSGAQGVVVGAHLVISSGLSGAPRGDFEENHNAGGNEANDGNEVKKTGEFVESLDLHDRKDGTQKQNDNGDAEEDKSDEGKRIKFSFQTQDSAFDRSAEDTLDARAAGGGFRPGDRVSNRIDEGRASHHEDKAHDRDDGRD